MQDPIRPADDAGPAALRARTAELAAANINPRTGLATDYLNHFNEAVMLLDMIPDMPDCAQDFLDWRPLSYAEHFSASNFHARDLAIVAYHEADPAVRAAFDGITTAMTTILTAVAAAMREARHASSWIDLARLATVSVKPMVAMAGGIINGVAVAADDSETQNADIDVIMSH